MKRIKRNTIVEKGILLGGMLPQINDITMSEHVDDVVGRYKETCGSRYMFTAEEAESIMQALKSMPGYSPERFCVLGSAIDRTGMSPNMIFSWQLYNAYIMLSITNPELFEDYEEAEDGKDES